MQDCDSVYSLINYNPVDCKFWGIMEELVHKRRLDNVDELKWRLIDVWQTGMMVSSRPSLTRLSTNGGID